MPNKIVHWELMGPDADQLVGFYGEMFGWQMQAMEGFDGYHLVADEQAGVGGAVGKGSAEMPSYLTLYVEVDSVDDHLAKIEAGGGTVVAPKTSIPGIVTFALFSDPAGNVVGIVESATPTAE